MCWWGKGVRAYFVKDDLLYEADGDNGNWWLKGIIHIAWASEIIEALTQASKQA